MNEKLIQELRKYYNIYEQEKQDSEEVKKSDERARKLVENLELDFINTDNILCAVNDANAAYEWQGFLAGYNTCLMFMGK